MRVDLPAIEDRHLADAYAHLTAAQAARIAAEAGAGHLVLTHFSQRYTDPDEFLQEAEAIFPAVTVAADLDRIQVPGRIRKHAGDIPPNGAVRASSSPQDRTDR